MQLNVGPALGAVPSRLSCDHRNASVANTLPRAWLCAARRHAGERQPYTNWISTPRRGLIWTLTLAALLWSSGTAAPAASPLPLDPLKSGAVTHGPILGRLTHDSIRVWARTKAVTTFRVRFSERADLSEAQLSSPVSTDASRDFTGWVDLAGLKPDTSYFYAVEVDGRLTDTRIEGRFNSFRTLPHADLYRHPVHNPTGLFNFSFEVGSCNQQAKGGVHDTTYATMLRTLKDEVSFHVVNGDWIYELGRDVTAEKWAQTQGVSTVPEIVHLARGITGVWENYRLYLDGGRDLANFHREVPLVAMFDDHEIYNDIFGAGQVGLRVDARKLDVPGRQVGQAERTVFRDPALQAWQDYVGWANPDAGLSQPIRFGRGTFQEASDVLTDPNGKFDQLDLARSGTLHVQWGFGNTGVYRIEKVLDRTRVRIHPAAIVTEEARYSIGTQHHTRFRVGNCEFFVLDTRSSRTLHNAKDPFDPKTSMLGQRQIDWLMREMSRSGADFFFVVSSVSFVIPHDNGALKKGQGNKDESWTAHAVERNRLLDFFDGLKAPVFMLTGDIHNSFSIRITPKVWEFLCGPHSSPNHYISDMASIPLSGPYDSRGRPVTVRWGTGVLDDAPKPRLPTYCVVQVNNVFNSPDVKGKARWMAYQNPQVVFRFHDGLTGKFRYAEPITAR